jgi:hypothetical protein
MEDAAHIRHLYHDCLTPGGMRYSYRMLARMYRVSETTIQHAVDRKGAYKRTEESTDVGITN